MKTIVLTSLDCSQVQQGQFEEESEEAQEAGVGRARQGQGRGKRWLAGQRARSEGVSTLATWRRIWVWLGIEQRERQWRGEWQLRNERGVGQEDVHAEAAHSKAAHHWAHRTRHVSHWKAVSAGVSRTGIFTLTFTLSEYSHRYPSTLDEFYKARLPGMFEEERADKRMKLPTPETWETQVSLKGNKASTWQDLIGQCLS